MNPPPLDGVLVRDPRSRQQASVDFGHLVHQVPDQVLRPGSANDIATVLRWAAGQDLRVTAQGTRHSVYGRSQVEHGVVVDMSGRAQIHRVEHDHIVLDAGATWREVLTAALPHGFTPLVLPEYLDLSVGGTIAAGGVGGTSWRHGTLSDTVLALEVVTGDGRVLTCSHDTNRELFDAVRAGLGQTGIITKATLKLARAPETVRRYQLGYADLDTMLADQRLLLEQGRWDYLTMLADQRLLLEQGRWDYLQGGIVPRDDGGWTCTLDGSKLFSGDAPDDATLLAGLSDDRAAADVVTQDYRSYVDRFTPLEETLRAGGQWLSPHPWLFTFIGSTNVRSVLAEELAGLTPEDLGASGRVAVFPLWASAVASPLFRLPAEPVVFALNLMRYAPADSPEATAAMVKANRTVYERVRSAGGTLNPTSALPMSARDWREHFGPEWARMSAAKDAFDPKHTLTPGYEVFASQ